MAKLSAETKARNARSQAEKSAKAKALKAKQKQLLSDTVSSVNSGKVIDLPKQAGTKGKGKPKSSAPEFDTSVPLAPSGYDGGTEANKLSERVFKPTESQYAFVEKLANAKDFNAQLKKLGDEVETLQWKVHAFCVAMSYKLQAEKQDAIPLANDFLHQLERLGKGSGIVRVTAIRDWFLKFAPVDWDSPAEGKPKEFVFSRENHKKHNGQFSRARKAYVNERLSKPFNTLKPETDMKDFDLLEKLRTLQKAAFAAAKKSDAYEKAGKSLHIEGIEAIGEAIKAISAARRDDSQSSNNDDNEPETVTANVA